MLYHPTNYIMLYMANEKDIDIISSDELYNALYD